MTEERIFYVYVIFRPNGSPCYVGKGKGGRWKQHVKQAKNPHLRNIYVNADCDLPIVKARESLTESEAFEVEAALISAIGRDTHGGPLVNLTDGGDGVSGLCHSDQTRLTMANKTRERWADPLKKAGLISALVAGRMTPEASKRRSDLSKKMWGCSIRRLAMSEIKKRAYLLDPLLSSRVSEKTRLAMAASEVRDRVSAGQKARYQNPEELAKLVSRRSGTTHSLETREKIGNANRGQKRSEEARAKMSAWQIGRKMSDEAKTKMSIAAKRRFQNPEQRKMQSAFGKAGATSRWSK